MKIKRIEKSLNKISKQQALRSLGAIKLSKIETNLKQVEISLNKTINLIYMYHRTNKKILFIGFPKNFSKTLKGTKHLLVTESLWFNGMISNKNLESMKTYEKAKMPKAIFKTLLNLAKKFDLVVVCNLSDTNTATKESLKARIPVVSIKTNFINSKIQPPYKFLNNYNLITEKNKSINFIISLLRTCLEKAKRLKLIKTYDNSKKLENMFKPRSYRERKQ